MTFFFFFPSALGVKDLYHLLFRCWTWEHREEQRSSRGSHVLVEDQDQTHLAQQHKITCRSETHVSKLTCLTCPTPKNNPPADAIISVPDYDPSPRKAQPCHVRNAHSLFLPISNSPSKAQNPTIKPAIMPPSEYPPYPYAYSRSGKSHSPSPFPPDDPSNSKRRRVHFPDTFSPSSFSIRIYLGPRDNPSSVIKISVEFEPGRFPRVTVRSKKPDDERRRRRRRRRH